MSTKKYLQTRNRRADWSGLGTLLTGRSAAPQMTPDYEAPPEANVPIQTAGMPAPGQTKFFIRGSRYAPTIDLGPILKPRETGVNPMEGDPYKATTGVGGFFRRLLGDNADELNAAWANQRIMRQMAGQDTAAAQRFELDKLAKQQEGQLALAEAERQGRMGLARYQAQADLDKQAMADAQALIRDAANNAARRAMSTEEWTARQGMSKADIASREKIAQEAESGDTLRAILNQRPGPSRYESIGGGSVLDTESGIVHVPGDILKGGGYLQYKLNGQPADAEVPGKPSPDALSRVKARMTEPSAESLADTGRSTTGKPAQMLPPEGNIVEQFKALQEVKDAEERKKLKGAFLPSSDSIPMFR